MARGKGQSSLLSFRGLRFANVRAVIRYLDKIEEQSRYAAQEEILDQVLSFHHKAADLIEELFDYVKHSGVWKHEIDEASFNEQWAAAHEVVAKNVTRRDENDEAKRAIRKLWGGTVMWEWVESEIRSTAFLAAVRKLSRAQPIAVVPIDEIKHRINDAVLTRLENPGKGKYQNKCALTGDLHCARQMTDQQGRAGATPNRLQQTRTILGPFGLVQAPNYAVEDDSSELSELSDAEFLDMADPAYQTEGVDYSDMDWEFDTDAETTGKIREPLCKCSEDVTRGWRARVSTKKKVNERDVIRTLGKMMDFQLPCYRHLMDMGSRLGLILKGLNHIDLHDRLKFLWEHRLQLGNIKADRHMYKWFCKGSRPARKADYLSVYKFAPIEVTEDFDFDQNDVLQKIVQGRASGDIMAEWNERGSLNVSLFSWWWEGDKALGRLAHQEFNMYRHHLRLIKSTTNLGFCNNMLHSIAQQMIRQDPVYYMLYAALRPDKHWRLVSYPYYTKYALPGDSTYFRHIDVNIPELLSTGRGINMIQGTVSLDNENEDNSTVIAPGMHHKLAEYWERIEERGQQSSGFIKRITDAMFTKSDMKALGCTWENVPCKQGDARVTMPQLLHGANGPCTTPRRTVLPWFEGVQADDETLEVMEGGTWTELSAAHRDLTAGPSSPSGHPNRYGKIPYPFPAAVHLTGLGPLSDALVCRIRWKNFQVQEVRDLLLTGTPDATWQYINQWRHAAKKAAIKAYEATERAERLHFGVKSYFYRQDCLKRGEELAAMESDDQSVDTEYEIDEEIDLFERRS